MNTRVTKARAALAVSSTKLAVKRGQVGIWRLAVLELVVRKECRKLHLLDEGLLEVWRLQLGMNELDEDEVD